MRLAALRPLPIRRRSEPNSEGNRGAAWQARPVIPAMAVHHLRAVPRIPASGAGCLSRAMVSNLGRNLPKRAAAGIRGGSHQMGLALSNKRSIQRGKPML
jgi:hypothetical protein